VLKALFARGFTPEGIRRNEAHLTAGAESLHMCNIWLQSLEACRGRPSGGWSAVHAKICMSGRRSVSVNTGRVEGSMNRFMGHSQSPRRRETGSGGEGGFIVAIQRSALNNLFCAATNQICHNQSPQTFCVPGRWDGFQLVGSVIRPTGQILGIAGLKIYF
jgi:hypothetical protein